jgi:LmbE family N-acetylglucosaminyl deacetylase
MISGVHADSPVAGNLLVCAPHPDDDILGCGMLIALHRLSAKVHVMFATDGAGSPQPPPGRPEAAHTLPGIRAAEAVDGLAILGVPAEDVSFLGIPDGSLGRCVDQVSRQVAERAHEVQAAAVLVPFRYDRHPDHLALNRAAIVARREGRLTAEVLEYFVYTKWRMLRTGDVRDYVATEDTTRIWDAEAARRKQAAIACHRSQTTLYFPGQRRAILTAELITEACESPEAFLRHRLDRPGHRGLARGRCWVPVACALEPALKRLKDRLTGDRVQ